MFTPIKTLNEETKSIVTKVCNPKTKVHFSNFRRNVDNFGTPFRSARGATFLMPEASERP